ncbi:MAG TPA: hypothetical protein VFS34_10800 [Thermoanaerobaculia bacterium]|nr:hypothetical protein [Thermoanaerobaculia bacterium]
MFRWLSSIARRLELDKLFTRTGGGFFLREEPPGEPTPPDAPHEREIPPSLSIHVSAPRIEPRVSAGDGDETMITTFVAAWRPNPSPPEEWIELLRSAPFGTTFTSARELQWDGKDLTIERVNASEIEAFAGKMDEWVDYANSELASRRATPEAVARFEAGKRAAELQDRFRR